MPTCVVRVFFTILASIWLSSCGDTSNDELVEENESFDEKKIYKLKQYVGAHTCAECHQESHENGWSHITTTQWNYLTKTPFERISITPNL